MSPVNSLLNGYIATTHDRHSSPFPFVAGHPAIDFNTSAYAPGGVPVETIGDGRALPTG